jgi:hypothetical protein
LDLLAAITGATLYSPDFVSPQPAVFDNDLQDQLHQVATTPADRVGYEMTTALRGHPWGTSTASRRLPACDVHRITTHFLQR